MQQSADHWPQCRTCSCTGSDIADLPAKSTRLRAPCRRCPDASCRPVMYSVKTEWLREETAFMAVDSTARAAAAFLTRPSASAAQPMGSLVAPWTTVWLPTPNLCICQYGSDVTARDCIVTSLLCLYLPHALDN